MVAINQLSTKETILQRTKRSNKYFQEDGRKLENKGEKCWRKHAWDIWNRWGATKSWEYQFEPQDPATIVPWCMLDGGHWQIFVVGVSITTTLTDLWRRWCCIICFNPGCHNYFPPPYWAWTPDPGFIDIWYMLPSQTPKPSWQLSSKLCVWPMLGLGSVIISACMFVFDHWSS